MVTLGMRSMTLEGEGEGIKITLALCEANKHSSTLCNINFVVFQVSDGAVEVAILGHVLVALSMGRVLLFNTM